VIVSLTLRAIKDIRYKGSFSGELLSIDFELVEDLLLARSILDCPLVILKPRRILCLRLVVAVR
jgi:hypothetical protein